MARGLDIFRKQRARLAQAKAAYDDAAARYTAAQAELQAAVSRGDLRGQQRARDAMARAALDAEQANAAAQAAQGGEPASMNRQETGHLGGLARWDPTLGRERITVRELKPEDRLPTIPITAFIHAEYARQADARGDAAAAAQHRAEEQRLRQSYEAALARLRARTDPTPELAASRVRAALADKDRYHRLQAKRAAALVARRGDLALQASQERGGIRFHGRRPRQVLPKEP